ncbi:uncharacterized protein [Primulina huaijiensis]|uniref:uncharacterized protein isoform X2 n=1 Tax=Primulina huaijiensis TaxID=1492673 RepID=UPI003CC783E5
MWDPVQVVPIFTPFLGSPVSVHETGETSCIPFQENRGLYNLAWWPVMTPDTTAPSYWLNWRFLLCATWILIAMVSPALLIWSYEGNKNKNGTNGETQESAGCSYEGEAWGTCLKTIHPIWLLGYRIVAFCSMLALLLADSIIHSARIFYFYTQWTFTLVTVYFGLATLLSFHGYLHYCHKFDHDKNRSVGTEERGSYITPKLGEYADVPCMTISLNQYDEGRRQTASTWEYTLQINFSDVCWGSRTHRFCLLARTLPIFYCQRFQIKFCGLILFLNCHLHMLPYGTCLWGCYTFLVLGYLFLYSR